MFEDRDVEFYLGEHEEDDKICPAIPIALKRMGEGEKSKWVENLSNKFLCGFDETNNTFFFLILFLLD